MRVRGVQAEILASLALVMATAVFLLAAFFFEAQARHLEHLVPLLGKALAVESQGAAVAYGDSVATATWYRLLPETAPQPHAVTGESLAPSGLALAAEARRSGGPLLRTGRPWEPIWFATPVSGSAPGVVAVAVLPPPVEGRILFVLLVADCVVFTALGGYLLRRRVISPLRRLSQGARAIEETGPGLRVAVEGVREAVEVAEAMSDMSEALERRTGDLQKAVTELREANVRLRRARAGLDRSERLAAVGQLAAGVAHEVGNPMGAVLAFLDLIARDSELAPASRAHLARAVEQCGRVRRILGQLLDFSRPPRATLHDFDLAQTASQTVGLVSAQRRHARIAFDVSGASGGAASPTRVFADESVVAQILLNLVLNAADAVAAVDEPRIRITLATESRGPERPGERFVVCRMEDNGPGVLPEDRQRIFDPFFTTKPPGEGTGLGLANALRQAEELGGGLECGEAGPLGGGCFLLRLRASRDA
jgi:C4-dicarboxylate-specific signal transduction histidine kinase